MMKGAKSFDFISFHFSWSEDSTPKPFCTNMDFLSGFDKMSVIFSP